jgi:hypothetical protein
MYDLFVRLILLFTFAIFCPLLYAQQDSRISLIEQKTLNEIHFEFPDKKNVSYDAVLMSQLPINNSVAIQFDKSSDIYHEIEANLKRVLSDSIQPDTKFIKTNARFYSFPSKQQVKIDFKQDPRISMWSQGYDVVYLPFCVNDFQIVVAMTGDTIAGGTYLFLKKSNSKNLTQNISNELKIILRPDEIKLIRIMNNDAQPIKYFGTMQEKTIPVFIGKDCICIFIANRFYPDHIPGHLIAFSDWFATYKKTDKIRDEHFQKTNFIKSLIAEHEEKCQTLIKTPQGRAELIELAVSNEHKAIFQSSTFFFDDFRRLPQKAILDYYSKLGMSDEVNFSKIPCFNFSRELPISSEEIAVIRKLLKSDDLTTQWWGVRLIRDTKCKSLVPDLVNICLDKRYKKVKNSCAAFIKGKLTIVEYDYGIIMSIAELGDERTLKSFKRMLKSNDTPDEFKPDIKQAIDHIENNIVERERRKQNWLNYRRNLREKKIIAIGEEMIDFDKPDPEPISPEGFRKWETSEGLFKTTAKFVGLKEIKDKTGKIIDKDIQLLRNDNKTVAIELSALRLIDREYIRQQFEPEREWISTDNNIELKLKAKLLGKFDKEIIVQE